MRPRGFVRWNGAVVALLLLLGAPAAFGLTFTVNSTGDGVDVTPGDGFCLTAASTCTLRAAIQESNMQATADLIDFSIPPTDLGYSMATGVFTIGLGSTLNITRTGTVVDGKTQATNQTDSNPGMLGVGGTVGVGPDGKPGTLDETALPKVNAPEVQIQDGAGVTIGFRIQANSVTIRGLAMLGFGTANGQAAVVIDAGFTGTLIEENVIGSTADSFTVPTSSALRGQSGIESLGGVGGTVRNNLVGFHRARGIWLNSGSSGWTVSGNEVRDNGVLDSTDGDGIALNGTSTSNITGNLAIGSTSQGLVITGAGTNGNTATYNTITGNGVGTASAVDQSAGVTFRGSSAASDTTLDRNLIQANYGAGVQINNGATRVRMTRNSIADNGTIESRDMSAATGQIGIDLNSSTDNNNFGTTPFFSINDDTDGDGGGNNRINFPILDTVTISGGDMTLTGWSLQDAVIELFVAAPDGSNFGEGQTWVATFTEGVSDDDTDVTAYSGLINGINQGADTTHRFSFTVPTPAGVGAGSKLTATGTDVTLNETSEFSGLLTVPSATVSGTVFEDVNYGGGAGRDQATASGVARSGARVELYDAAGVYVTSTTTDGSGDYSFAGLGGGDYTVRVVNSTLTSSRPGYAPGLLAVQTYRTDASTGSAVAVTSLVGGQDPTVADAGNGSAGATMNTTNGVFTAVVSGTAQSITNVTVGAGDVSGLDFGYNFDTIVNTNNAGQGSLRQFLLNARAMGNAGLAQVGQTAGKEVSIFMIPAAQLTSGVAVIVPASTLPAVTGVNAVDTSIDGTTQTLHIGDTNLGISGTGFLGAGGNVGLGADGMPGTADEPALGQVAAPEVEIKSANTVRTGLDLQADSATIRGIAIHGFGQNLDADIDGNIRVGLDGTTDYTDVLIENNIVGATAFDFVSPPVPTDGDGLIVRGADDGTLRNNLIGFNYRSGIKTHDDVTGWLIEGNEFRDNGTTTRYGDGVDLGYITGTTTISRNLLVGNGASGVDSYESNGSNTITDNTIIDNGFAGQANQETSGIRLFGTDSDVTLNLFQNNFGAGVLVVGDGTAANQPSLRNRITRNSFSGNGSNAIDLLAGGGDRNFGDGITVNGGAPNACSYLTSTGNDGIEYPVISSVVLSAGTTTVVGQACPSSDIEVYRALAAAGDTSGGTDYGEGELYLGSSTTDGSGDFTFVTTALTTSDAVTAIVIDSNDNTSEFGPNFAVPDDMISGTVFEDVNYGGGAGRDLASAAADAPSFSVGRSGVTVELYGAAGGYLDNTTTDAAGAYAFGGLADGDYLVRVVNEEVTSSRPGAVGTEWPVQTFRTDASSGAAVDVVGEVGGASPADQDDPANATSANLSTLTAQSVAPVTISGGTAVTGVDFGFNFDTIVNTNETGQGTLAEFIDNGNDLDNTNLDQDGLTAGVETSLFMIPSNTDPWSRPVDPNFDAGRGVAVITPTASTLPAVLAADTTIDGTTQTSDVGNTNTAVLGTGGNVGVDDLALGKVAGPEIEIVDGAALLYGIDLQADRTTLRGIAIYGFGTGNGNGNVRVGTDATSTYTDVTIEDNVLGSTADAFVDPDIAVPGSRTGGSNLVIQGADNGTVQRNLVGYAGALGVSLNNGADDWTVTENESRRNGFNSDRLDGLSTTSNSTRTVITRNLFVDNHGAGVDFFASLGSHTVENNTITQNGWGGVEPVGIRMFSEGSTIRRNIITDQTGAGVLAVVDDPSFPATPAIHNKITENQFSGNGSNAIDLQTTLDVIAPGDGITLNDGTLLGDSSVPDVCGIVATHGNEGLDTPIVDLAIVGAGTSLVRGRACPGSTVEIYRAVAGAGDTLSGNDYGEGVEFLDTATAAPVTGEFSNGTVPGLSAGDYVAAIAIDTNDNTSEFSGNLLVAPLVIQKRAFFNGSPIVDGATLPRGSEVKFLLFIDNPTGVVDDLTLEDALDSAFGYQTDTIKLDNTLLSSVVCPGGVCDEAAIFGQVNGSGTSLGDGDAVAAPIDADEGSYDGGTKTVHVGDGNNLNNAQLDIAADSVLAVVFTVRMQ